MSDIWMRETQVTTAGKSFKSTIFKIDFTLNFDTDPEPNDGEIEIYNLSEATIAELKKGTKVVLNSGYQGDIGTILAGTIDESKTRWEDLDKITKLVVGDATEKWINKVINKSYAPGTKAGQIVRDMLAIAGIEVGAFSLPNDITYTKGRTVSSALQVALRYICGDCGAKVQITNGIIYITGPNEGIKTGFLLNASTGLIESPQKLDGDGKGEYSVKMLLNHRIGPNAVLQIQSKTANGWFRVIKGKHVSDESDHITEVEVVSA